jgi:hypothetical protein
VRGARLTGAAGAAHSQLGVRHDFLCAGYCPEAPRRICRVRILQCVKTDTSSGCRLHFDGRHSGRSSSCQCGSQPGAKMGGNFVAVLGRHVRRICEERLQVFRRGISGPASKEVCRGLDCADLLRDRGCNPLVQRHPVFLSQTRRRCFDRGRQFPGGKSPCSLSHFLERLDGPGQPRAKSRAACAKWRRLYARSASARPFTAASSTSSSVESGGCGRHKSWIVTGSAVLATVARIWSTCVSASGLTLNCSGRFGTSSTGETATAAAAGPANGQPPNRGRHGWRCSGS